MSAPTQIKEVGKQLLELGYNQAVVEAAFSRIHQQYQRDQLRKDIETCKDCPLSETCKPVAGTQFLDSSIMIVGDFPSLTDVQAGIPFAGVEGYILTIILEKLNVNRDKLYLTNVVKCNKEGATLKDAGACMRHIYNEISVINPQVIITLGTLPFQLFAKKTTPLGAERGKWFKEEHTMLQKPVISTYHPRDLMTLKGELLNQAKREIWADLNEAFKKVQLIN